MENAREANEIYDAIKEGGSMRILGHLMRVPASSYFFALSYLRKISKTNLFILLTFLRFFSLYSFSTLDFRNKLSHTNIRLSTVYHNHPHILYKIIFPIRELPQD